jgi:putative restriction endonuclease
MGVEITNEKERKMAFDTKKKRRAKSWRFAREIFPILQDLAKQGRTIFYKELGDRLGVHHRAISQYPLRFIKEFCREKGYPLLNTLVVNQRTNNPGAGGGKEDKDYAEEQGKVFEFDWDSVNNPFI